MACLHSVNCSEFSSTCSTDQPGSVNDVTQELWEESCSCPNSLISPDKLNQSCVQSLVAYRFGPVTQEQRSICGHNVPLINVTLTSVLVGMYFGLPLLCLVLVWVKSTCQQRQCSDSALTMNEGIASRPAARVKFEDVRYKIGDKEILKGLCASLEPSTMTAIMGVSLNPTSCSKYADIGHVRVE